MNRSALSFKCFSVDSVFAHVQRRDSESSKEEIYEGSEGDMKVV